jgi:hypothetical protein
MPPIVTSAEIGRPGRRGVRLRHRPNPGVYRRRSALHVWARAKSKLATSSRIPMMMTSPVAQA